MQLHFLDRLDCDVDYEAQASEWRKQALEKVKETLVTTDAEVVQITGRAKPHM